MSIAYMAKNHLTPPQRIVHLLKSKGYEITPLEACEWIADAKAVYRDHYGTSVSTFNVVRLVEKQVAQPDWPGKSPLPTLSELLCLWFDIPVKTFWPDYAK